MSKISIVTPVYNDWDCFQSLISDVAQSFTNETYDVFVLAINDCSTINPPSGLVIPDNIDLSIVDLVTNVGHQRAILIGLCHLYESKFDSDFIVVMDSDGEDKPVDILNLVKKCETQHDKIIFARRSKRSEGHVFKFSYKIYKLIFTLLTGKSISFGNFSCIPNSLLPKICNDPNFWNNYSSAVINSKLRYDSVSTERGNRYFGESKMNFTSLILHGLSSLSLHVETIIVRVLKFNFLAFVLLICGLIAVISVKYFTDYAIPGWSSFLFAIIFNIIITVTLFSLMIVLIQLNNRKQPIYKPLSFYKELIAK